ncbi:hypothetical protein PV10_05384 [Exophiala mesophila]|uniref:RRM domain-containing protein n=1 Tax=Exophiala mesophila TaxID=212818 RepID=A0A0D1XRN9_EXOME|nr:uncharacterized protein PV10_05384 [Exophiala mesophila]KIV90776.1 hypothetical protein PV10_05384 [Exophiala mesophila]
MSAMAFSPLDHRLHPTISNQHALTSDPRNFEPGPQDRRMSTANDNSVAVATVLLRRLPRNTTSEAVRTMLLFAEDLQDTEIVPNEYEDDAGFSTAIARFSSMTGATEVQALLDGKPNTAGQAKMIVDVISNSTISAAPRRNTIDPLASRKIGQSMSPAMNMTQKSSRFNGTFQALDKTSPPLLASPPDHSSSETSSHMQTLFSPHSPGNSTVTERSRVSGKMVIDEDGGDEDTRELLNDPLGYLNNSSTAKNPRKAVNTRVPTAAFSALSLNTNMSNGTASAYGAPRSAAQSRPPHNQFSPNSMSSGPYTATSTSYLRHNYPPVNPADQNPPCNTLYVGNLPIDTSEDELKAMFSKQRGYKRLCFRTKQNGPMCFVEFEDVSFATKALNELYGAQLHNSVKGGIRLSFSKNPLGVRAGQPGSANPTTPLNASGPMSMNGFVAGMSPSHFSTASGPPPGLSMPPGLSSPINGSGPGGALHSQFVGQGLGLTPGGMANMRGISVNHGLGGPTAGGNFHDYMLGR